MDQKMFREELRSLTGGETFGDKVIFGTPDNCLVISLETNGYAGHYEKLHCQWVRPNTPTVTFNIMTSDPLYAQPRNSWHNTKYDGCFGMGYLTSDGWYMYTPKKTLIVAEVQNILRRIGVAQE